MASILCIETGTDVCSVALALGGRTATLRESAAVRDHARMLAPFIEETLAEAGVVPAALDAVAVSMGPGSYTGLRIGVSLAKGMCYALGIPLIGVGSLLSLATVASERRQRDSLNLSTNHMSVRGPEQNADSDSHDGVPEGFRDTLLCPMIDARRMEVYAGVFDMALNPLSPVAAHIITADSFREFIPGSPDSSGISGGPVSPHPGDASGGESGAASGGHFTIFGDGAAKCVGILPPQVEYIDVQASAQGLIAAAEAACAAGRFEDVAYFEPFYLKDFVVTTTRKRFW